MEIDQFAEFSSAVVRQLPRGLNSVVAQRWIRDQEALKRVLRSALKGYELYSIPQELLDDQDMIVGSEVEKHLKKTGLIKRTFSLEDELVKAWLASPETFPYELRDRSIILWQSRIIKHDRDPGFVACLGMSMRGGDEVRVSWPAVRLLFPEVVLLKIS